MSSSSSGHIMGLSDLSSDVCSSEPVTDTATGSKSDPSGTVTFGSSGAGAFSAPGTTCTLVSDGVAGTFTSSCSVTFTPSASGTQTITGTYNSAAHAAQPPTLRTHTVPLHHRSTSTSVDCPTSLAINFFF